LLNIAVEVVFEGEIPSRLMFAAAMVNPEGSSCYPKPRSGSQGKVS
jgi:hypothetical protein